VASRKGRRRFGWVRKLPSGRFQASYLGPDDIRRPAPNTFSRKTDAEQWLSLVEGELIRGDWSDPEFGCVPFREFGGRWLKEHRISRRTREEYDSLWRHHVESFLGHLELSDISTGTIRTWRSTLLAKGRSEDRTAKAYRLVRAILNTAVDDGRIKRNPCRIKGAGEYRTAERPTASIAQVYSLAEQMPKRFRVLVLAAAFTGLRWGELIALRRCDIDLASGVIHVRRRLAQLSRGGMQSGAPKSVAGVRNVAIPAFLVEELDVHISEYADAGPEGLIFRGEKGGMLRRSNFGRATNWTETVTKVALPKGFHFHDLRHTGNQLAANAGATTRELMHRMGHGSMRAALIYQHATIDRDRQIADALGDLVGNSAGGSGIRRDRDHDDQDDASTDLGPVA